MTIQPMPNAALQLRRAIILNLEEQDYLRAVAVIGATQLNKEARS